MVGTADSILIREVPLIQSVLYREVPLYTKLMKWRSGDSRSLTQNPPMLNKVLSVPSAVPSASSASPVPSSSTLGVP